MNRLDLETQEKGSETYLEASGSEECRVQGLLGTVGVAADISGVTISRETPRWGEEDGSGSRGCIWETGVETGAHTAKA